MNSHENQRSGEQGRGYSWLFQLSGAISLALYAWLAFGLDATSQLSSVLGYLATMAVLFACYFLVFSRLIGAQGGVLPIRTILLWAVLFRVVMLGAGLEHQDPAQGLARDLGGGETGYETFLLYDNDVWRYLWDGHLLARGESPYASTPFALEQTYLESDDASSAAIESLALSFESDRWLEVYDNLSFTNYATVYGPLAQGLFALVSGLGQGSVLILKLVLTAFDLGTCWLVLLLARRCGRPEALLAYAWNPLVIKEISGSAHVDSVMVFLAVAAVWLWLERRVVQGLVVLTLASLVKFVPLVLFPVSFVYALRDLRNHDRLPLRSFVLGSFSAAALFALCWLPFRMDLLAWSEAVRSFLAEWAFNAGPYRLIVESSQPLRRRRLDARSLAGASASAHRPCHAVLRRVERSLTTRGGVRSAGSGRLVGVDGQPLVSDLGSAVCSRDRLLALAGTDGAQSGVVPLLHRPEREAVVDGARAWSFCWSPGVLAARTHG